MNKQKKWERLLESNLIKKYLEEIARYNLISKDEEYKLSIRMSEGDKTAREILITSNLRFVVSIAKKYLNKGLPFVDLINEGNMGLILACDRFDYRKGYRFISYAVWWIRQYIAKAFAEQLGLIRLPMNLALQNYKIKNFINETDLDRVLTNGEIANHFNINQHDVDIILSVSKHYISFETPIQNENIGNERIYLENVLLDSTNKSPEEKLLEKNLKLDINKTLNILSERERLIIQYRYGLDGKERLKLQEIGQKFKLTKERIRQIEKMAISKLKKSPIIYHLLPYLAA